MNVITPVDNTNNIRYADFVRITTRLKVNATAMVPGTVYTIQYAGTTNFTACGATDNNYGTTFVCTSPGPGDGYVTQQMVYRFSSAPAAITIPEVDGQPFTAGGQLLQVGSATRDVKSTANETSFTLLGIDTAMLGWVLGQQIKGSSIEAWHGFFNENGELIATGGTGGLYKFFTGYINNFAIGEQWMEEAREFVGTITVNASSTQIILQNRVAGRYTNGPAWQFFSPGDTSMDRVAFISTINYQFGREV